MSRSMLMFLKVRTINSKLIVEIFSNEMISRYHFGLMVNEYSITRHLRAKAR